MFGPITVVPARNIGSAGPAEGTPIVVNCPLRDSLRSVYPWFVVFGLLLVRHGNRTRPAWALLLPLLAIYGVLRIAENAADDSMAWYISIYLRSFIYESLRALAIGLALLLAISDLIRIRSRLVRRLFGSAVVLAGGLLSILLNAPVAANTPLLAVAFTAIVIVSALGLSVIGVLSRWPLRRQGLRWHASVYFAFCVSPILLIESVKWLSGSHGVLTATYQFIMVATAVSQVVFAPYFVFFCFAVLAMLSPFYRERLAHCFAKEPIGV